MLQNADIFDRYEQGRLLTERHGGRNDRFRGTSPAVFDIGIPIMWNPGPLEETRARTQPLSGQPIRKPTPATAARSCPLALWAKSRCRQRRLNAFYRPRRMMSTMRMFVGSTSTT